MKKILIVLSLWLVPIVAVGATLQRSTLVPVENLGSFKVSGSVVDEVTGQPVSGVKVSLAGCPGAVGVTRTNGSFAILDVPPGVYTLRYAKDGYKTREDPATVNNDLNVNATLTPLIQPPPPSDVATITGKVTDAKTGTAVAGATATLEGLTYTTGSNGTYSFSVKMGSYTVSVSMMGYETKTVSVNAAEAKTYNADVSLTPIPPPPAGSTIITGKVTDEKTGLPIAGATVRLNGYQTVTGSDGVYSLNVSEGTYTLMAGMTGYETKTVTVNAPEKKTYTVDVSISPSPSAPPTIQVQFDLYEALMTQQGSSLAATTKVTVVVQRTDGKPVTGVTVSFSVKSEAGWLNFKFNPTAPVTDSNGKATATLTLTAAEYLASHWMSVEITASATVDGKSIQASEYLTVSLPCSNCH